MVHCGCLVSLQATPLRVKNLLPEFEHRAQPEIPAPHFMVRLAHSGFIALALTAVSLGVGLVEVEVKGDWWSGSGDVPPCFISEGKSIEAGNEVEMTVVAEQRKIEFDGQGGDPKIVGGNGGALGFEVEAQMGVLVCGRWTDGMDFCQR
jgi:hypothetical protein